MLNECRFALGITGNDYDAEIIQLIQAAVCDLEEGGVAVYGIDVNVTYNDDGTFTAEDKSENVHPSIARAIVMFVVANMPDQKDVEMLNSLYEKEKGRLCMSSAHTDWGEDE